MHWKNESGTRTCLPVEKRNCPIILNGLTISKKENPRVRPCWSGEKWAKVGTVKNARMLVKAEKLSSKIIFWKQNQVSRRTSVNVIQRVTGKLHFLTGK